MSFLRFLEKFTSEDGSSLSYTWPLNRYEYQSQQGLRTALREVVGADYAYDVLESLPAPKGVAVETVRFLDVQANVGAFDDDVDDMRAKLQRIGRGKLWLLDSAAARRWAYARLHAMPDIQITTGRPRYAPVVIAFARESDWYGETEETGSEAISSTPHLFTINNPGTAVVRAAIFRLQSGGATGFTNPRLQNLTNGQEFSSTRDAASADDELKVDCGRFTVGYSDDDGASYADDFNTFTYPDTQVTFMELMPGDNSMRYTDGGTPSLTLAWAFDPAYH